MNRINEILALIKKKSTSFILLTLVVCFISFAILHFYNQGTLIPRFSRVQRFSQEELYENLFRFDLLDNDIIRSNSINPRIIISVDPNRAGDRLFLEIEHLSVDSTVARILFAREDEEFNSEHSVRFALVNGLNTIHLPYGNYNRLRLDLARQPDISMAVTSMVFANRDLLPTVFWLHFIVFFAVNLISAFMLLYNFLAIRKAKKGRLLYTFANAIVSNIFLFIKSKIAGFILLILVVCFVSFSILHFYNQGVLLPRFSRVQRFSQEELYDNLLRFDLLDNNIIRSYSVNSRIIISIDPNRAGDRLFIEIEHLSVVSTNARVLFARESEAFNSEHSVRFALTNGLNTIYLPYGNYDRLRLDLVRQPDISMAVTSVVFANRNLLPAVFWLHFFILLTLNLAIVFMLFYAFSATRKALTPEPKTKPAYIIFEWLLYTVTSSIIPSIFLFNLYNRNRDRNHIYFGNTIVWALLFLVLSIALFWGIYWLMRSLECTLLILVLYWVAFWFFGTIHSSIVEHTIYMPRLLLLSLIGLLLSVVCVLLQRLRSLFGDMRLVFRTLALVLCGLFISNFSPGLRDYIVAREAESRLYYEHSTYDGISLLQPRLPYIRSAFYVDPNLPQPDIYWFHVDGMLSLETFERFFGLPQDDMRARFEERGFLLYESARLSASSTSVALPALFMPQFYDKYYGELMTSYIDHYALSERLRQDGVNIVRDVLPYNETFMAFKALGYEIITFANTNNPMHMAMPFNRHYSLSHDIYPLGLWSEHQASIFWRIFEPDDLSVLLSLATPISILLGDGEFLPAGLEFFPIEGYAYRLPDYIHGFDRRLYRNLIHSASVPGPKFLFAFNFLTHPNVWHYSENRMMGIDFLRYYIYPLAFTSALEATFNVIDIVLYENPYAVIVLQSDHGFHVPDLHEHLLDLGYSQEVVMELRHSIFSAVRIPPQYGGLDAPLHPLNISRELVNRFVGENYDMLLSIDE